AVGTTVEAAAHLGPVADDGAATVLAPGRQARNGALEAVEGVAVARHDHLERLVVVVPADLALGHGSHLRVGSTCTPPRSLPADRLAYPRRHGRVAFRSCRPTDVAPDAAALRSTTWSSRRSGPSTCGGSSWAPSGTRPRRPAGAGTYRVGHGVPTFPMARSKPFCSTSPGSVTDHHALEFG